jgi:hypothetical protein
LNYDKEKIEKIRKCVNEKGLEWVIAAMVDGSVGYHSHSSAENLLKHVLADQFWVCERTTAMYKGDASEEILHDIRCFEALERVEPETVKRIVEFVKKTSNLDVIQSWTFSAMYPTLMS